MEGYGGLWRVMRVMRDYGGLWRVMEGYGGLWRIMEDYGGLLGIMEVMRFSSSVPEGAAKSVFLVEKCDIFCTKVGRSPTRCGPGHPEEISGGTSVFAGASRNFSGRPVPLPAGLCPADEWLKFPMELVNRAFCSALILQFLDSSLSN
jgi:hypothetical protein